MDESSQEYPSGSEPCEQRASGGPPQVRRFYFFAFSSAAWRPSVSHAELRSSIVRELGHFLQLDFFFAPLPHSGGLWKAQWR